MPIVEQVEILKPIVEQGGSLIKNQPRIRVWFARQLFQNLVHMIIVDVAVAAGPHKLAWFKAALLGDHLGEQRVGRDVDVARLADFLEAEKKRGKLADPGFQKWFSTVENQVATLNGLTEEIHRMFQSD